MINRLFDTTVALIDTGRYDYPDQAPFNPPIRFPEYPFDGSELDNENYIYDTIRQLFVQLKLDLEKFGTPAWNPLGTIIQPGDNVVLKPNLVISDHPDGMKGIKASIVQGSIIRVFLDFVWIANRGQGKITIADSPIKEVDFARIMALTGIRNTVQLLNKKYNLGVDIVDFRDLQVDRDENRVMVAAKRLPGDPDGYQIIDIGKKSMLKEISSHADRYRSTASVYENVILKVHNQENNFYSIPNRILQADVVISLAKLKTHRKAGVTLSLKNMVGITNEKRWLPHHRVGSPNQGGDLYADRTRLDIKLKELTKDTLITHSWGRWLAKSVSVPLYKVYNQFIRPVLDQISVKDEIFNIEDGDWYGNDTVWRMVLDLNTLLFYTDKEGVLRESPQRRYFSVIDGIIAGIEEGPLKPRPYPTGIILAGFNPVAVDMVCTRIMGFDIEKIPLIWRALEKKDLPLGHYKIEDIKISSNFDRWENIFESNDPGLAFTPSKGWLGHIEL